MSSENSETSEKGARPGDQMITLYLPAELKMRLKAAADRSDRSVSNLVVRLLEKIDLEGITS